MITPSDVEYLAAPEPFDHHLVYVYRTGVLRGQVKDELRTAALRRGEELYSCSPGALLGVSQGVTLFSGTHLCDWSEADTAHVGIETVRSALASKDGERIAFFIRHGDSLLDDPIWPSVRNNNCAFVEEQIVTARNLEVTLAFLQNQSDIPYSKSLTDQEAFVGYFSDLIETNRTFDLTDFMREFDRAVLLYADPASGVFDGKAVLKKQNERNAITSSLREFIQTRETSALVRVVRAIERQRRQGRGHLRLITELCRSTLRILDQQERDRSNSATGAGPASARALDGQLMQWITILLSWTDRLRALELGNGNDKPSGDLLLVCIDQMGREYLDQFESDIPSGPPSSAWSHLRDVLAEVNASTDELGAAQARLVQEFAAYLGAGEAGEHLWTARLRAMMNAGATAECQNAANPIIPEPASHVASLFSFADILGHDVAVRSLQTRLRTERWSARIILHGPEGVGKRTLARLYAKALTCEGKIAPVPCGSCSACAQFDKGGGFGLVELDATASSAAADVDAQLRNLRFATFARHRVVIVRNLDRAPVIADTFLKTLERNDAMTTFVITLRDVEALSPAARSRCVIYKLKPLSPPLRQRLTAAFLRALNYEKPDAELCGLIAAAGGGLPGRIEELCRKVAAVGPSTIGDARRALNLDWASEALSDFRSLLSDGSTQQELSTAGSKGRPRQFRLLLEHLCRADDPTRAAEPALWHIEAGVFQELVSLAATSADHQGVDSSDVLAELAGVWLEDDYSDAPGFLGAVRRSRQIISGRRWMS